VHVADILDATPIGQAVKKTGSWDVLVANAGYVPPPALIETSDPEEW
jgi:NAD(P)-dependent dehydrogenase (short-subunit alcohol dehydrogenase family)